jgi:DNA-binding MarR family transcriptional regulator
MAVVGRILRLAGFLERRANSALEPYELPVWAFDVLGTLRRSGPPFTMTPTELMRSTMLTSGAMTNRIDRLEALGLVCRMPDPLDRRSVPVSLTARGLEVVDAAAGPRFQEAKAALEDMPQAERRLLADLLRKLLLPLERPKNAANARLSNPSRRK